MQRKLLKVFFLNFFFLSPYVLTLEIKVDGILDEKEWNEAKKNGVYSGTSKDIEDGYIHFSEQQQIQETLKLFYQNHFSHVFHVFLIV